MFHALPFEARTVPPGASAWSLPRSCGATDERLPLNVTFSVFASQINSVFVTWIDLGRSSSVSETEQSTVKAVRRCVQCTLITKIKQSNRFHVTNNLRNYATVFASQNVQFA
jgi:hypothetical protein